jgi:hypothetical protein
MHSLVHVDPGRCERDAEIAGAVQGVHSFDHCAAQEKRSGYDRFGSSAGILGSGEHAHDTPPVQADLVAFEASAADDFVVHRRSSGAPGKRLEAEGNPSSNIFARRSTSKLCFLI